MRVLVTRAREDAQRTARALEALGHAAVLAPLRERVSLAPAWPEGPFAALIATSRHALADDLPPALLSSEIFCVGQKTAAAAREAGFARVHVGPGDGAALAQAIRASLPAAAPLLYLTGRPRHGALEAGLAAAGFPVTPVLRYAMARVPALPAPARAALEGGSLDAVLHYSAESARAWLALTQDAGLARAALVPRQLCLSPAVAEVFAGLAPGCVLRIAARPEEAALLQLLTP